MNLGNHCVRDSSEKPAVAQRYALWKRGLAANSPTLQGIRPNKNHLGNVLNVVSDKKHIVKDEANNVDYFTADVNAYFDYYPYGMLLPRIDRLQDEYLATFESKNVITKLQ